MKVSKVQYLMFLAPEFEASEIDIGSIDHAAAEDWDKALVEDEDGQMWLVTATRGGRWSGGVETGIKFFPVGRNSYEGTTLKPFIR